jgi:hypothetical protein
MATTTTGHVTEAITTIIVTRPIVEAAGNAMPRGRSKSNVLMSEETCDISWKKQATKDSLLAFQTETSSILAGHL